MPLKNKKILFLLTALLITAIFGLLPTQTQAQGGLIESIALGVFSKASYFISYLIGLIGGLFFTLAGWIVDWALKTNAIVAKTPVVTIGWGITRDLANLGFVIVILVIAFATALRYEKYGMKQTLGKLIVIALLINFSLTIAGVFLDFAGVITNFFISKASLDPLAFAGALAAAFNPQKLLEANDAETKIEGIKDFGSGMVAAILNVFFAAFFTIVATIAMFALGIMLFIRFIYLTILLVLMPLAWLCYVLPATASLWGKWWKEFVHWVIFAPVTSFFIYLAILTTATKSQPTSPLSAAALGEGPMAGQGGVNLSDVLVGGIAGTIGQMIAVIGLLIGGLIAANSLGIAGANAFVGKGGLLGKMGQGLGKWAGRQGTRVGTAIPRIEAVRGLTEKMQTAGAGKGFVKRTLGAPVRALGTGISKWRGAGEAQVEAAKKGLEKYSPDELVRQLFAPGFITSKPKRAAILEHLREKSPSSLGKIPNLEGYFPDLRAFGKSPDAYTKLIPTLHSDKDPNKDVYGALKQKDFVLARSRLTNYLGTLSPKDKEGVLWSPIFEGKLKGPLSDTEWNAFIPEMSKATINTNDAELLSNLYKSLSRLQRRSTHSHLLNSIPGATPTDKANWLNRYRPALGHFYRSSPAARKLGVNIP